MRRKISFLLLLLIILTVSPCLAWAWSGKVIGIADGDTITVLRDKEQVRIRLYGIDTPERGQAFGTKAKKFTSDMVFGKVVEIEPVDIDRYGRTVALVAVFKRLVNEELVNAGFAWVYTRYCTLPFARGGSCWCPRLERLSEGFGLIRTQYRPGSLGGRRESEAEPLLTRPLLPNCHHGRAKHDISLCVYHRYL